MGNSQNKNIKIDPCSDRIQSCNTSITPSIKPPKVFVSEEELFKTWSLWKSDFLIYRKMSSKGRLDGGRGGDMLLNIMGPIGQNIYEKFTFDSSNDKKNLDMLLNKFDLYCMFFTRKRLHSEDIYMYIHDLQLKVKEINNKNAEELMKNKILKEIDQFSFTNVAKKMLPSFIFSTDFNKLTLKEIAFIWKSYDQNHIQLCDRCGNRHNTEQCPSLGKQCSKCNEWNHYRKRCPLIFVFNCNYCGGAHFKKQCPAYNEICSKCKKLNHFVWKCQCVQILCQFCGLSHPASRSLCSAKDNVCTNCRTKGHIASRCRRPHFHRR